MTAPLNRSTLLIATVALLLMAGIVLCITRLPLPLRIAVAATDVIAAAILLLALRQQKRP